MNLGTISAGYLGFSLSVFAGLGLSDKEFWFIFIPVLIGFTIHCNHKKKEDGRL
jgi:hypothetical protein